MSEPDISTLAKRLAEQNNVDWRALKGSGPSGKVVERDVLDYLARVMAGEEALDPTPEPLPDGMEAWPDQDLRSFQEGLGESAADMREFRNDMAASVAESLDEGDGPSDDGALHVGEQLHAAGRQDAVEDVAGRDLAADDVTFERDVEGVRTAGEAHVAEEAARGNGAPIDEDIFLFDDEEDPGAAVAPEEPAAGAGDAAFGFEQPGAAAAPVDQDAFASPAADAVDFDAASEPDDLLVVEGDDEPDAFAPSPVDGDAAVDVGVGWQAPADAAPTPAAEPAWEGEEIRIGRDAFGLEDPGEGGSDDDLWVDDGAPSAEPASADDASGAWAGSVDPAKDMDLWESPAPDDAGAFDEAATGFEEPEAATGFGATDGATGFEATDGATGFDGTEGATGFDTTQAETGFGATAGEPDDAPPPAPAGSAGEGAYAAEADAFGTPGSETGAEMGDLPAAGVAAMGAAADATRALPLARTTTLLRRHIDVSALAAAQLAVGQELGEEEPLGASAFLLRAVAKAARDVAFDGGQVALAVIGDGVTLRRVDEAASRSFGSLVAELREAGVEEDEIGLVAADLSGLDLDEAVLDVAAPVVTLGRILYDNQRGAYRSTLSFSGDLPLELGARLLARVADLLDAPVRLVL